MSQADEGFWNVKRIDPDILFEESDKTGAWVKYSKPIYSRDMQWAFIHKSTPTSRLIFVSKFNGTRWKYYKLLDIFLFTPRVKIVNPVKN